MNLSSHFTLEELTVTQVRGVAASLVQLSNHLDQEERARLMLRALEAPLLSGGAEKALLDRLESDASTTTTFNGEFWTAVEWGATHPWFEELVTPPVLLGAVTVPE